MKRNSKYVLTLSLTLFVASTLASVAQTLGSENWVGSWAASQQPVEASKSTPEEDFGNGTLRQIVHLSIGGSTLRVHLSNEFGTSSLHLKGVHIARALSPAGAAIDRGTDRALSFGGAADVTIPAGAEYLSDPIEFPVLPMADMAISIAYDQTPVRKTGHPGSRATSYFVSGDLVSAPNLPDAMKIERWYQISGIDVRVAARPAAVVVLGDSITDGHGATTNGNDRWTDVLAAHLNSSPVTRNIGVLNQGIGGNRILLDGIGSNLLARFDRDVLAQTGVRYLMVLEGINDLGTLTRDGDVSAEDHASLVHRMESAYTQVVQRAHDRGIFVIGCTILPDGGSAYYHPGAASEADRVLINDWIRTPGHFDASVDFDKLMRDPTDPSKLLSAYDSGDGLHPSPAGYKTMGNAVALSLFH